MPRKNSAVKVVQEERAVAPVEHASRGQRIAAAVLGLGGIGLILAGGSGITGHAIGIEQGDIILNLVGTIMLMVGAIIIVISAKRLK